MRRGTADAPPVTAMPRTAKSDESGDSLHRFMTDSHRHLDEVLGRLLGALAANAPDARALWDELDRDLSSHMAAEERFVLPSFMRVDPEEAVALLDEHGRIREMLLELGVAVDLHALRVEQARRFIEMLLAHADREDRLLYRWADERLDRNLVDAARHHLAAACA